jgi:radical SAM superfamily enzyme YgiQ (UPF0313 family)
VTRKTPVYLVNCFNNFEPPLALGLIAANIKKNYPHLLDAFDFAPSYVGSSGGLMARYRQYGRGVFLFSSYAWNIVDHLEISKTVKEMDSANLTLHGGPSVPRHERACESFLREHTHADLACQGEGEMMTPEILEQYLGAKDYTAVNGVSMLREQTFVQAAPRARHKELDHFPSPYLTGEFDHLVSSFRPVVTLETNRGCPYGCTFCDWGQATLQKIHCFSMERVKAELTWAAQHKVAVVGLADANFGILPRDLEIAQFLADLKRRYGYPLEFRMNNAKNATSRVSEIVRVAREAGLVSQGVLSIQTRDEDVLTVIQRQNIRPERYDALLREFRSQNLPVHTEIMMALPGSTYNTFVRDLQWACDKNIRAHVSWTAVLPNTPMAEPEYMAKHQIKTAKQSRFADPEYLETLGIKAFPPNLIVSAATFNEEDFLKMANLSSLFHLFQGESVLKHIMFFLRWDHAISQIKFIEAIRDDDLCEYPALRRLKTWKISQERQGDCLEDSFLTNHWPTLYDEARRYVGSRFGICEDSALETVYQVQRFVMAFPHRGVPSTLELEHDFARYVKDIFEGNTGRRLEDYGPGTLTVFDPSGICRQASSPLSYEPHCGVFELDSDLVASRVGPLAPASRSAAAAPHAMVQ